MWMRTHGRVDVCTCVMLAGWRVNLYCSQTRQKNITDVELESS